MDITTLIIMLVKIIVIFVFLLFLIFVYKVRTRVLRNQKKQLEEKVTLDSDYQEDWMIQPCQMSI
jgi:heme/copper-type cytochrome/quinol oxidase subunit 2